MRSEYSNYGRVADRDVLKLKQNANKSNSNSSGENRNESNRNYFNVAKQTEQVLLSSLSRYFGLCSD